MNKAYVHGYHQHEHERLRDQGSTLVGLIHDGTAYAPGSRVLEPGCGVGVQSVVLGNRSPGARFVAFDHSAASLALAERAIDAAHLTNVELLRADIYDLPFGADAFDHVFVCFLLEHLRRPLDALSTLHRVLKPGGTVTIVEGDHGSTYFHPDSSAARAAIQCQVTLQSRAGGNAMIGRQLYPLMIRAGLTEVRVEPRMVYVDGSRPNLIDGFTRRTFTAMIKGVRARAIAAGLTTPRRFDAGIRALDRTARTDGVFCYTFFKGVGQKPLQSVHPTACSTASADRR